MVHDDHVAPVIGVVDLGLQVRVGAERRQLQTVVMLVRGQLGIGTLCRGAGDHQEVILPYIPLYIRGERDLHARQQQKVRRVELPCVGEHIVLRQKQEVVAVLLVGLHLLRRGQATVGTGGMAVDVALIEAALGK